MTGKALATVPVVKGFELNDGLTFSRARFVIEVLPRAIADRSHFAPRFYSVKRNRACRTPEYIDLVLDVLVAGDQMSRTAWRQQRECASAIGDPGDLEPPGKEKLGSLFVWSCRN